MKLVVRYNVSDGCTFSCDITQPIEYDSAEALIVAFEEAIKEGIQEFEIGKHTFNACDFICESGSYSLPDIYTLEEWFAIFSES